MRNESQIVAAIKSALGPQPPRRLKAPTAVEMEEARIVQALSMLGDEVVADYKEGRMPREDALRITRQRNQAMARMGRW